MSKTTYRQTLANYIGHRNPYKIKQKVLFCFVSVTAYTVVDGVTRGLPTGSAFFCIRLAVYL